MKLNYMNKIFSIFLMSLMLTGTALATTHIHERSSQTDIYLACLDLTDGNVPVRSAFEVNVEAKNYDTITRSNLIEEGIECQLGDKETKMYVFEMLGVMKNKQEMEQVSTNRVFRTSANANKVPTQDLSIAMVDGIDYRLNGGSELAKRLAESRQKFAEDTSPPKKSGLAVYKEKYSGTTLDNQHNLVNN